MKLEKLTMFAVSVLAGFSSACSGNPSDEEAVGAVVSPQCESPTYLAFDTANHANQDVRLQTHSQIVSLMEDGASDLEAGNGSMAKEKLEQARELYLDGSASADLREKVQGRVDEHLEGAPLQGDRLDESILAWLDFAADATTPLEATVAAQWVDKSLTEFLFLSVHHEALAGTRKNWDEAYGYYGSGPDNREGSLAGFAQLAFKQDSSNGTNFEPTIYNHLIDGSCELDTGLRESGQDALDMSEMDTLADLVDSIDVNMQKVLALSVGHEAHEMVEQLETGEPEAEEVIVEASEMIPYFLPLGRIMEERGGESAERATEIRGLIEQMPITDPENVDLSDTSWVDELGDAPERIIELVATEYDIEVED